eukprot:TRINITY_DN11273_c0_g2_i2.p1 TRINITY_DN11273_c0_g2~~TRINITY_DN11273_c0_g2_i2.p1  ORF type:complete len:365 (+),score=61.12 TRINITY_DN11273_c0_g2_i2:105-1097(+)
MNPRSPVGHIVRQVFLAIFLILFAITQAVILAHGHLNPKLYKLKTGTRLMFAGVIMVIVMTAILVLFGFVARRSKSRLVRYIGLALVGVFFVGSILWVAGLGKLIDIYLSSPYIKRTTTVKVSLVGSLLGVFFFSTSFLLLCLKDYIPGGDDDDDTQDDLTELTNVEEPLVQTPSSRSKSHHHTFIHNARNLVHLLGMILYLSMNVGYVADYFLREIREANFNDTTTTALLQLLGSGVVFTLVSSTALALFPFVTSPRTNGVIKGAGFLLMFLVFLGSIFMVVGLGRLFGGSWDEFSGEEKFQDVGIVLGVFGFTNVFILYCLPDYGYLM